MGGLGSGGQNRISIEQHRRRGTFRPKRHAQRIGDVLPLPVRGEIPQPPSHLGLAGRDEWTRLWRNISGLTERDYGLVTLVCEAADQCRIAYQDWASPKRRDPKLARVLVDLRKGYREDLALLGMSARDRAAMAPNTEVESPLESLKRKVVRLRQPS